MGSRCYGNPVNFLPLVISQQAKFEQKGMYNPKIKKKKKKAKKGSKQDK